MRRKLAFYEAAYKFFDEQFVYCDDEREYVEEILGILAFKVATLMKEEADKKEVQS